MSRFLFVLPPLPGHAVPAAGVAGELRRRGHELAVAAPQVVAGDLVDAGATTAYPAGDGVLERSAERLARHGPIRVRGTAAVRSLWDELLVPLAVAMSGPVGDAVDRFQPDVVVTDQHAFAGAVVAAERGLPWAVSAASTAELLHPLDGRPSRLDGWCRRRLQQLYDQLSLPQLADAGLDSRVSPWLVIQYSTWALVGAVGTASPDLSSVVFVGPVEPPSPPPAPSPGDWSERHDVEVLVSLGTLTPSDVGAGRRFLARVMEAAAGQPYGVLVVGEPAQLPPPPDNVVISPTPPRLDRLPRLGAVVCTAEHGLAVGALGRSIPVVCCPTTLDQRVTTTQVVRAGAGRRLAFGRAGAPELRAAIGAVLRNPSYREAAARIAASCRAAGGAPVAADRLEALVTGGDGRRPQTVDAPPSTGMTAPVR